MQLSKNAAFFCFSFILACGQTDRSSEEQSSPDSVSGTLQSSPLDFSKKTHIFFVAQSKGQHDQFIQAALSRAYRYRELYPHDQIVFYGNPDVAGKSDEASFRDLGIRVITSRTGHFYNETEIIAEMRRYSKIATFDYYGHSNPWATYLFSSWTNESSLSQLRKNFLHDATASLNGCNSALDFAPRLSRLWGVPVAAAATGTNFQQLHNNGNWYFNDPGTYPSGGWKSENSISYRSSISCRKGACYRMKPENAPYRGVWGNFGASGLGFYKFFCTYGAGEEDCQKRMAQFLFSFPSTRPANAASSPDDFREAVIDHLCPISPTSPLRERCRTGIQAAVNNGTHVYSPFSGNTLQCDLSGCRMKLNCELDNQGRPVHGSCTLSAEKNNSPTTYVKEYLHYMAGFALLKPVGETGPLPESTLKSQSRYRIVSGSLNCRRSGDVSAPVEGVFHGGQEINVTVAAGSQHIVKDSRGLPWVQTTSATGTACYVSASYPFITPVR